MVPAVRVLLDTHVFLWWNQGDAQLSRKAVRVLADPANSLVLSVASAWEIAVKTQSGKLRLPEEASTYVRTRAAHYGVEILPVHLAHALALESLPLLHRDPFDRMLIVQSRLENLPMITADLAIHAYPINTIW
jgi:PIN domain nuclease of toxin-antitoxin system